MNFINPDLTWKPVPKGYRSASKRNRKLVSGNFIVGAELPDKRSSGSMDEKSGSDTEKNGVAVLGHRFSDNIEHVPIKKRRFRSPSPSSLLRTLSPHSEMPESNSDHKESRRTNDSSRNESPKVSTADCAKFDCSGIEILAAVACSNNIVDAVCNGEESSLMEETAREGVDSSASAVLFEENAASPKDLVCEVKKEASSLQDCKFSDSGKSPCGEDINTTEGCAQSRHHRLHWDLNTTMDVWDNPSDVCSDDSQVNAVENNLTARDEKVDMFENCDGLQGDCKEASSCDVTGAKSSSNNVSVDACQAVSEENTGPELSGLTLKLSAEICSSDVQLENILSAESAQQEQCNDGLPCMAASKRVNCENDCDGSYNGKDSCRPSGSIECKKSIQDALSSASSQKVAHASPVVEPENEAEKSIHCGVPNCEYTSASGVSGVKGEPLVILDAKGPAKEASSVNNIEADSPAYTGSEEMMQKSYIESDVTPREACRLHHIGPSSSLAKGSADDMSDGSCELDLYQGGKVQSTGTTDALELKAGYDSQFEDGELREPDAQYYRDENEDEDGEVEHVDYGSESDVERPCVDNGKEQNLEGGSSPGFVNGTREQEICGTADASGDDSESPKTRSSDNKELISGVSRTSNRESLSCTEGSDLTRPKDVTVSGGENVCNLYAEDGVGSDRVVTPNRGRSPGGRCFVNSSPVYWDSEHRYSHTHRRGYGYGPHRPKNMGGRGYITSAYHRDMGAKGFPAFDNHVRRQFVNSSNVGFDHPTRTRSPTAGNDAYGMHMGTLPVRDISPVSSRFRRCPENFDRGVRGGHYRPVLEDDAPYANRMADRIARRERSISPVTRRQPYYNLPFRKSPSRSRSRSPGSYMPGRGSRLRSSRSPDFKSDSRTDRTKLPFQKPPPLRNSRYSDDRYGPVDGFRGRGRGGHYRPVLEDNAPYANRMADRMVRRERSISPVTRRRPYYNLPFRKSPSRSGSRSPVSYMPGRGSRLRSSRSPDFKSDSRTDRTKLPFQKPPDRYGPVDGFRGRRSPPVRLFRQNERFDSGRPARRLHSDDQFKPMMQSRKFTDIDDGGAGPRGEYGGSDGDRRKIGTARYENRTRQHDTDGVLRRIRYNNTEECFVAAKDAANNNQWRRHVGDCGGQDPYCLL